MKVKKINTEEEFKPFIVELTFESEDEAGTMLTLLRATRLSWECGEPCYAGQFSELKELLLKKLK
jgi:hypothetical protein